VLILNLCVHYVDIFVLLLNVELKSMCIDLFMLNLCTSIFLQSTRNVEIKSMCIECVHQIYI
jgi:hypothetical protein